MGAPRIAIIGAGPAGCMAARSLHNTGCAVVVFERDPAVGGRTQAWHVDGALIDSGAGFFTNFYPTLQRLVTELGLGAQVVPLSRTTALCDGLQTGTLRLGSLASFAGFPFLSTGQKLRLLWGTVSASWIARRTDLAQALTLAALDHGSIAEDAIRRMGAVGYHALVRPGIEPYWYFGAEEASQALYLALTARASTARFFTLRSGMETVARRLVDGLDVRLGQGVSALRRTDGGWVLETEAGSDRFDGVVMATTADQAGKLSGPTTLPGSRMASYLQSQRYAANIHVAWVVEQRSAGIDVSGISPCGPGRHPVAAITYEAPKSNPRGQLSPDEEVISVFLSSDQSRLWMDRPDERIYADAWQLARGLHSDIGPAPRRPFGIARRERAIPIPAPGRYALSAAAQAEHNASANGLVFAGDYFATATVESALWSGERAASVLLASMA